MSMTTIASENEVLNLWDLDFMFAIEMIDPQVAKISMRQDIWEWNEEGEHLRSSNDIRLISCRKFIQGGQYEGKYSKTQTEMIESFYKRTL